ncbi:hypothetical protein [Thermoflexus sp.]|uniref:hypothetical protein n=1 Tax=Thermoflexus sp. TaxID=1969742 RepID=UPI00331C7C28
MRTVMVRARGPLYWMCRAEREACYARPGFRVLPPRFRGLRLPWRVMGWDPREVYER